MGHEQDTLFVIWAYAGAALLTLGLIGATWLQSRRVRLRLAAIEAQGIRRRSAV